MLSLAILKQLKKTKLFNGLCNLHQCMYTISQTLKMLVFKVKTQIRTLQELVFIGGHLKVWLQSISILRFNVQ